MLADVQEGLDAIRVELALEVNGARPAMQLVPPAGHLDDRELLERAFAARNGAKFRALWEGDRSGYGSESEADQALVRLIAFWTGPDPGRIDWLFRQSALVREKWDRESYREATIATALGGMSEFYGAPAPRLQGLAKPTPENALMVATAAIKMEATPLVEVTEVSGGKITLDRADGLRIAAPSLEALATFAKLAAALAAGYGHELVVPRDEKVATAHRFVAALRRHLGQAKVDAVERQFEAWFVDLVKRAGEAQFTAGDGESRMRAWRALDELDPEAAGSGARAFASAVVLAHDLSAGDRYLRASWAHEYVRRCGWKGGLGETVGAFEACGLERPSADGRVRARWRAGGDTLTLRFWVIPAERFERWRSDS
jgi:hypothetical protein